MSKNRLFIILRLVTLLITFIFFTISIIKGGVGIYWLIGVISLLISLIISFIMNRAQNKNLK